MLYSGLVPDIAYQVFDLDMRGLHDVSCKVLTWVMESSALMSSWLLVAMTMQRAMSVTWPHRVTFLCSRRKAYITIVFIVLTASESHVHFLLGLKVHEADAYLDGACQMSEEYAEFWGSVWSWVFHVIIYSLVPTVLLLISNFALIRNMRASARQVFVVGTSSSADKLKSVASSMTVTLITISVTFLLLVTPIEVVIILWHMMSEAIQEDPRLSARMDLAWAVTNMCWYANSAVNFLLYCLSGSRFREEFFLTVSGATGRVLSKTERT
nr:hypothetical protein BaRGS_022630 [Batillaria attramentaria]